MRSMGSPSKWLMGINSVQGWNLGIVPQGSTDPDNVVLGPKY